MKGSKDKEKQSPGMCPCSMICACLPLLPPLLLPSYYVIAQGPVV